MWFVLQTKLCSAEINIHWGKEKGEKVFPIVSGINKLLADLGYWNGCKAGSKETFTSALVSINTQEHQDLNRAGFFDGFLAGWSRQLPLNALAVLNFILWHWGLLLHCIENVGACLWCWGLSWVTGHLNQWVVLALNTSIAQGCSGPDSTARMEFLMFLAAGSAVPFSESKKWFKNISYMLAFFKQHKYTW